MWDIAAYFSYPDWWTPYNSMTRKHLESDSWWRRITLISDDARLYNPGAGAPCPLPLACSTRSTPFRALVSEYHAFIRVPSPRSGRGSMWSDQRPNTFQHFEASECLETWKCRLANCKGFCFSVICWKVFGPCFGQERRTLRNWVQNFIEHHKKLWKSAVWISLMMVMMMLIATIWLRCPSGVWPGRGVFNARFRVVGGSSPANTLLIQEGPPLAEASFRDLLKKFNNSSSNNNSTSACRQLVKIQVLHSASH